MSLHDIDRGHHRRSSPLPNANDAQAQRMAHNTTSTTYRTDSGSNQRIALKNGVILYYDDQDRVIGVDGFIPELAPYPVKIFAKYGYDVFTDILGITAPKV